MKSFVYMDFKSGVQLLTSSLKQQLGEENVRPYFGSGMTQRQRKRPTLTFEDKNFKH